MIWIVMEAWPADMELSWRDVRRKGTGQQTENVADAAGIRMRDGCK